MPSVFAYVLLALSVALVALAWIRAFPSNKLSAALICGAWLGGTGLLARSGVLTFDGDPPRVFFALFPTILATIILALSKFGSDVLRRVSLASLLLYQGFRVPVELMIHQLYADGVFPVQVTYLGRNFDVLTGIFGILLGLWATRKTPPTWALWAFNVIGLGLLVNVVVTALLSLPTAFRQFTEGPPITLIANSLFIWLPLWLVQGALFGHVLLFRRLRDQSRAMP